MQLLHPTAEVSQAAAAAAVRMLEWPVALTWFAVMAMGVRRWILGRAESAPAASSSFTASGP
jgi:hypothetical protein